MKEAGRKDGREDKDRWFKVSRMWCATLAQDSVLICLLVTLLSHFMGKYHTQ